MRTRIIAVLNQKGGVGKTTTCVNLGAALARRGRRVLLIDIDPQANLTVHLGADFRQIRKSTYSLLLGEHALAAAVLPTSDPNLRYVPATLALANAEIQLASAVGRELLLREAIEGWLEDDAAGEPSVPAELGPTSSGTGPTSAGAPAPRSGPVPQAACATRGHDARISEPPPRVDFVFIDCPPSLGILTMNALCAANEVLLPIQAEFFALQGVAGILESLKAVQRLNRGLQLTMVVPCMMDKRRTLAREVMEEVDRYFGKLVTRTRIRNNVKLAEAPSHGLSIFDYDPSSNGAKDYESLALEVLGELPDEDAEPAPQPHAAEPEPSPAEPDAPDDATSPAPAPEPPSDATAATPAPQVPPGDPQPDDAPVPEAALADVPPPSDAPPSDAPPADAPLSDTGTASPAPPPPATPPADDDSPVAPAAADDDAALRSSPTAWGGTALGPAHTDA